MGLHVRNTHAKIVIICRLTGESKQTFLEEFDDLLSNFVCGTGEQICGDLNTAGDDPSSTDERLSVLLDTYGYQQHVTHITVITIYGRTNRCDNLLDLLIAPQSFTLALVSNVQIRSTGGLSDHEPVVCDLSVHRHKPTAISYWNRNIKYLDTAVFDLRLRSSTLFTGPADTQNHYLSQLETRITDVLDDIVPLRLGRRTGEKRCTMA